MSQASILEQNTILNATAIEFPTKPVATPEAKVGPRLIISDQILFP